MGSFRAATNQFSATKFTIGISSFESTGFALLEASRFVTVTVMDNQWRRQKKFKILRCGGVYKIQTCVVKLYKGPQKYCVNIYYFVTSKYKYIIAINRLNNTKR
jgi:hypothetical protein